MFTTTSFYDTVSNLWQQTSRHVMLQLPSSQTLQTANDPKQLICGREENIKNQNS